MQRQLSVYDFFAILVPGFAFVAVVYAFLLGIGVGGWPPANLNSLGIMLLWLLGFYIAGHLVENLDTPEWFQRPPAVDPTRSNRLSAKLLEADKLGTPFATALEREVRATFGVTLFLTQHPDGLRAMDKDRESAFMLCWGYLQQQGDPSRPFMMQTLMRLCKSLRSVTWYATPLAFLMSFVHGLVLLSKFPEGVEPILPGHSLGWALGAAMTGLVAAYASHEFDKKQARYDEFFVMGIYRGFIACRALPPAKRE